MNCFATLCFTVNINISHPAKFYSVLVYFALSALSAFFETNVNCVWLNQCIADKDMHCNGNHMRWNSDIIKVLVSMTKAT